MVIICVKLNYCVGGFRPRLNVLSEAPLALPSIRSVLIFSFMRTETETDVRNTGTVPDPPPGSSPMQTDRIDRRLRAGSK